jgi:hypothetical protein
MEPQELAFVLCMQFAREWEGVIPSDLWKRVTGLIRNRDHKSLASIRDDMASEQLYNTLECQRFLMQISAFFKKNDIYADENACTLAAVQTFQEGERRCAVTNARISALSDRFDKIEFGRYGLAHEVGDEYLPQLVKAKRWIAYVLGDFKDLIDSIPYRLKVTSGASADRFRKDAAPILKLSGQVSCSTSCRPYVDCLAKFFNIDMAGVDVKEINWNRVDLVPKDWKTHRTIAMEPSANLPLQLSGDDYVKDMLKSKVNIDLSDQSVNQRLAQEGSVHGNYCTIDLSNASDTIALDLVAILLPPEFFRFFMAVRSPGYLSDTPIGFGVYNKFSSMGNGATFALETLIFASLCHAAGAQKVSVYGDDIIVENEKYHDVVALLAFAGFEVNSLKSYHTGSFRESCGGNYYDGVDITPFKVRCYPSNKSEWVHLVNGIVSIGKPGGLLWETAAKLIAEKNLPIGPIQESTDTWVNVDAHNAYNLGRSKWNKHLQSMQWQGFKPVPQPRDPAEEKQIERFLKSAPGYMLWSLSSAQRSYEIHGLIENYAVTGRYPFFLRELAIRAHDDKLEPNIRIDVVPATDKNKNETEVCSTVIRTVPPSNRQKIRRRWVVWYPPCYKCHPYIYLWGEYLTDLRKT